MPESRIPMSYSENRSRKNKNILFLVRLNETCSFKIRQRYSSISMSYGSVILYIAPDTLRYVLTKFPSFLSEVDVDPREGLKKLGFKLTEFSELEKMLYFHKEGALN